MIALSFIWPKRIVTQSLYIFFFLFGTFPKRLNVEHDLWLNSSHGTIHIGHGTIQAVVK